MKLYWNFFGLSIPSYGTCIALGMISANLIAFLTLKRANLTSDNLILTECYGLLGGFFGSKLLYLLVSASLIDWSRFTEPAYFNQLMRGGFVFYGGLLGGIAGCFLCQKIHHFSVMDYLTEFIYLLPLAHGFGRIGCFCAGCCFGIPYDGWGAVIFPEGCIAPAGIPLFPVQLVEAGFLFIIAISVAFLRYRFHSPCTVECYLLLYSILRFSLESFRFDVDRGIYFFLSTSQWISIAMLVSAILLWIFHYKKHKNA